MKKTEILTGIVIKSTPVKDADIRVKILTHDGLMTLNASGAMKPAAKMRAGVQLFTIAEFSVIGQKIVGVHVLQTAHGIVKDMKRYYLACAIAEVVAQCNGAGFDLTKKALTELNNGGPTREVFTDYFGKLLVELGYGVEADMDINTSFARHLDIIIPNTTQYL